MVGFETATAAAGCFALLAAFGGALDAGVLAEPKAHQAPMNAGKPFLRWTMALLALSGGIGLSIEGRVGHPPEILNGFSGLILIIAWVSTKSPSPGCPRNLFPRNPFHEIPLPAWEFS